ncbi:MAG: hypothetical protein AB8V23_02705 [Candidatus Midichloria sp.]
MGSFKPVIFSSLSCGSADCSVADFNGNGKPDLATDNHYSNSITVLLNIHPLFNNHYNPVLLSQLLQLLLQPLSRQQVLQLPLLTTTLTTTSSLCPLSEAKSYIFGTLMLLLRLL